MLSATLIESAASRRSIMLSPARSATRASLLRSSAVSDGSRLRQTIFARVVPPRGIATAGSTAVRTLLCPRALTLSTFGVRSYALSPQGSRTRSLFETTARSPARCATQARATLRIFVRHPPSRVRAELRALAPRYASRLRRRYRTQAPRCGSLSCRRCQTPLAGSLGGATLLRLRRDRSARSEISIAHAERSSQSCRLHPRVPACDYRELSRCSVYRRCPQTPDGCGYVP